MVGRKRVYRGPSGASFRERWLVLASMLAHAPAAQAAEGPTIASDKPDYRAGEVVTLTGTTGSPDRGGGPARPSADRRAGNRPNGGLTPGRCGGTVSAVPSRGRGHRG
jgi:hypothetical protein